MSKPMSDYISRADVLKYPIRLDHYDEENGSREFVYGVESVIEYVESLPSADAVDIEKYHELQHQFVMLGSLFADITSDRQRGKWLRNDKCLYNENAVRGVINYTCSVCGNNVGINTTNFCGECGADMRTKQTVYKLPGYDEIMERLGRLTLKGGDDE